MKDSKRIDNKAKSRRIAAYALAGCMAVTAAPINLPNMGIETVEAATTKLVQGDLASITAIAYSLDVTGVKADTTYAAIASKVKLEGAITGGAADDQDRIIPGKVTYVLVKKGGNPIWDSEGNYNLPSTTKIGYDNAYTIDVVFESDLELAGTPSGAAVDLNKKTVRLTGVAITEKYPSSGMLTNAASPEYKKASGIDTSKTGVYKNEDGWWLIDKGTAANVNGSLTNGTVEKNSNGTWYIGSDKKVDFTKTGIVEAIAGNVVATGEASINTTTLTGLSLDKYYVVNGKVDYNYTGIVDDNGILYNVVKGKVSKNPTVVKDKSGNWIYFDGNGVYSDTYDGFAKNENGVWYVEDGKVDFTKTDAIDSGTINATISDLQDNTDYYVVNGKVRFDKTGLVFLEDGYGNRVMSYVDKGMLTGATNITKNTLVKDDQTGIWYVVGTNGQIFTTECIVTNANGTWYCNDGKVDFEATGLIGVDDEGVYNASPDEEYFVKNGKVQTNKTGVVLYNECTDAKGYMDVRTVYVKNGKVTGLDINDSVVKASNGKWYAFDNDGELVTGASPTFAANKNGVWLVQPNGMVDFTGTGFISVPGNLEIKGIDDTVDAYFKDGKLQSSVTGIVEVKKASDSNFSTGVKYVKNGLECVETSYKEPTVIKMADYEWYYIDEDGLNSGINNQLVKNANGTWLVNGGKVDFAANGWFADADTDKTYLIKNGKVATDVNGIVGAGIANGSVTPIKKYVEKGVVTEAKENNNVIKASDGTWYYVDGNGNVNTSFNGLAENKNGVWAIKNGKVDFSLESVLNLSNMNPVLGAASAIASDKMNVFDSTHVLIKGGKVQFDYTGAYIDKKTGTLTYFEKGKVETDTKTGLVNGSDGKVYYMENGLCDTSYQGLAKGDDGKIWYVYNGIVTTNRTGIVSTPDVEGTKYEAGEYYVENGIMKADKTGLVSDRADKVYVVKSQVVTGLEADESVIKIDGTWYCINASGRVHTPSDSMAGNANGTWFIKDGKVDFTKKAMVTLAAGNVLGLNTGEKIYVSGGKFQKDETCVYVDSSQKVYVKNGVATTNDDKISERTAVKGTDGKWYGVESDSNSNAITNKLALAKTENGVALVQSTGVVDFKTTMLYEIESDADDAALSKASTGDVVYIKNGELSFDTTDIVSVSKYNGSSTLSGYSGTKKVYVKKGVATATAATGDTIVRGADDVLYYLGRSSFVVQSDSNIVGVYNAREYCVVNGKVNEKLTVDSKILYDKDDVYCTSVGHSGSHTEYNIPCKIVDGRITVPDFTKKVPH